MTARKHTHTRHQFLTVSPHVMPAGCHGKGVVRTESRPGDEVRSRVLGSGLLVGGDGGGTRKPQPRLNTSWRGGSCALNRLDAAPGGSRVLQGRVGRCQDSCLSGFISCSTSLMNRRHSSSCQGRATHCTATGSPTLFLTTCRAHRHQDPRSQGRAPPRPGKLPSWGGGAAQQGPPAVSRSPALRKADKACAWLYCPLH